LEIIQTVPEVEPFGHWRQSLVDALLAVRISAVSVPGRGIVMLDRLDNSLSFERREPVGDCPE